MEIRKGKIIVRSINKRAWKHSLLSRKLLRPSKDQNNVSLKSSSHLPWNNFLRYLLWKVMKFVFENCLRHRYCRLVFRFFLVKLEDTFFHGHALEQKREFFTISEFRVQISTQWKYVNSRRRKIQTIAVETSLQSTWWLFTFKNKLLSMIGASSYSWNLLQHHGMFVVFGINRYSIRGVLPVYLSCHIRIRKFRFVCFLNHLSC